MGWGGLRQRHTHRSVDRKAVSSLPTSNFGPSPAYEVLPFLTTSLVLSFSPEASHPWLYSFHSFPIHTYKLRRSDSPSPSHPCYLTLFFRSFIAFLAFHARRGQFHNYILIFLILLFPYIFVSQFPPAIHAARPFTTWTQMVGNCNSCPVEAIGWILSFVKSSRT